jgi:uncharacterized membrane-anchored protein
MATNIRRIVERLNDTGTTLLAAAAAMYIIAALGGVAVLLSSGEVGSLTMVTAAGIGTICSVRWMVLRVIGRQSSEDDKE